MNPYQNFKKSIYFLLICGMSIITISCKKENPNELCGIWAIDKMTVDGKKFQQYLNVNTFSLKCVDNSAYFHGSLYFPADDNAKWNFIETDSEKFLQIKSSIKIYNNKFNIKIKQLENGQFHLTMKNNRTTISAFKILNGK